VSKLDAGHDPEYLTDVIGLICTTAGTCRDGPRDSPGLPPIEKQLEAMRLGKDSPEERRKLIEEMRRWWRKNGSAHHRWWRFGSTACPPP
jgi:hypothetical protein